MRKKLLIILTFVSFIFLCYQHNVSASQQFNTSISTSNSGSIKVNNEISVSINLSNLTSTGLASGQYYISFDNSILEYLGYTSGQGKPNSDFDVSNNGNNITILYVDNSGGDNTLKNGVFATLRFKAKKDGTSNINLSGEGFSTVSGSIVDLSTNTASRLITVIKESVTQPDNNQNQNTTTNNNNNSNKTNITNITPNNNSNQKTDENETRLSNNSSLKKLEIEGFEINFNESITDYELTVPYEITKLNISYETSDEKATVEFNNKDLQVGKNEITIKVIAEDKTEKTYKIKVYRNEEVSVVDLDEEKNDIEEHDNVNPKNNNTTKIIICSTLIIFVLVLCGYALYISIKRRKK